MSETSVKSIVNENLYLVILNGTVPNEPPAIQSVMINVSVKDVDNVLVCDVWKGKNCIIAKAVATLLPAEVRNIAIKAANICEITHQYTVLTECHLETSFLIEIFNKSKEVQI